MKMKYGLLALLIIVPLSYLMYDHRKKTLYESSTLKSQIKYLLKKLAKQRFDEEHEFRASPLRFQKIKGLYSVGVHSNIIDKHNSYPFHLIRQYTPIVDNNNFVTSFVLYCLLEGAELGVIEIDQDQFEESIDALLRFRDKNTEKGIPQYGFYEQQKMNDTWVQHPRNIMELAAILKKTPEFIQNQIIKKNNEGMDIFKMFNDNSIFHFPADTDDSGSNQLLGYKLTNSPFIRQSIKDKWRKHNYNLKGYFENVKKYSYQPLGNLNSSSSSLDPRTYFAFKDFLTNLTKTNTTEFSLFTTWLNNREDQVFALNQIPENVNNFDVSVLCTSVFSIVELILNNQNKTEVTEIFDQELQRLFWNSTNTIIYTIESNLDYTHPDIVMTYYPSRYMLYFYIARIANKLNSNEDKLSYQILKDIKYLLNDSLRNKITNNILNEAKKNIYGDIYFEEFLGVHAGITYNETNTFCTIQALNSLIDIWTTSIVDEKGFEARVFDPQTPTNVTYTIERGMQTLLKHNSFMNSNQNFLYSITIKSYTSQFYYPTNEHYYVCNGTEFDPHESNYDMINQVVGVRGIIDEEEYSEMLKQKWFNHTTRQQFLGYSDDKAVYPYWSSPALTYGFAISLLGKYERIQR